MADLRKFRFDATQVPQQKRSSFEPLPEGEYIASIVASRTCETQAGGSEYLELEWEIRDGPHRGRRLWSRLLLRHPNERVVGYARADLAAICRAVGVLQPKDSCELHSLPVVLTVVRRPRNDGKIVNEIRCYAPPPAVPPPRQPQAKTDDGIPF